MDYNNCRYYIMYMTVLTPHFFLVDGHVASVAAATHLVRSGVANPFVCSHFLQLRPYVPEKYCAWFMSEIASLTNTRI
jgi:hypothetical protein